MMKIIYPYYKHFSCIAEKCPRHCCAFRISFFKWEEELFGTKPEWSDVDGKGHDIKHYLLHDSKGWFCKNKSGDECIFMGEDHLCNIQKRFGQVALPSICRTFPRMVTKYQDHMEYALDSCCPVVAASVWNWKIGEFAIEGTPCDNDECDNDESVIDDLTYRRNAAMRILADEKECFHDCLKNIADIFKCEIVIPDFHLSEDKLDFIRKQTLLLIWEVVLSHEHSTEGNVIITLILQFITEYSKHLEEHDYASHWEMSVDFANRYSEFVIGTPIEPDDEKRFIDIS